MKKALLIVVLFLSMALIPGSALTTIAGRSAGGEMEEVTIMPDQFLAFYNRLVDMKIAAAEKYVSMSDSSLPTARCLAERASTEVKFYKGHRAELLDVMVKEGIVMKDYKVRIFLTKSFLVAHPDTGIGC